MPTLTALAIDYIGVKPIERKGRFSRDGWFLQGITDLPCGSCKSAGTMVSRKHYVSGGDVKRGTVYHYWAIVCPSCLNLLALVELDPALQKRYVVWSDTKIVDCEECEPDLVETRSSESTELVGYLVLANSRKLGGHCVAVADTDAKWIRPVSDREHGELDDAQIRVVGGGPLSVLDVVDAEFGQEVPAAHQPEDRSLPPHWVALPAPATDEIRQWVDRVVDNAADFLHRGRQDRISSEAIEGEPVKSSLALVRPCQLNFFHTRSIRGNAQVRARFRLPSERIREFDLVVTDPKWETRVKAHCANGESVEFGALESAGDAYLTVSLGEPMGRFHYKLVAGIISI